MVADWPIRMAKDHGRENVLVVFDIDGVMTDGRLYRDDSGQEIKAFYSRDGLGMKALMRYGFTVAALTARESRLVRKRMSELGIEHLVQGRVQEVGGGVVALGVHPLALGHRGGDLGALVLLPAGEDDPGALLDETFDRAAADSAGATGDQGDVFMQTAHAGSPSRSVPAGYRGALPPLDAGLH